jgi:transcription termination factor Rho
MRLRGVVDFILPNQSELQSFSEYSSYDVEQYKLKFMVNVNHANYGEFDTARVFDREGMVEIKDGGFGVLHVSGFTGHVNDVFINPTHVKQLKIQNGEKVKVKSRKVRENYPEIAIEIDRIDNESTCSFDELESKPLDNSILIGANDIKAVNLGGRYYVNPSKDSYIVTNEIARLIQEKNKNIVVETLYLNAMIDKLPVGSPVKTNYIAFSKADEEVINGTNLFFERAKRIAEKGNNVVVVINEISQYAKSNNNIYLKSGLVGEISNKTSFLTKSLLGTAKNTNKGSITIIVVDPLRLPTGIYDLFKYDILPIFHETIK